MGQDIGFGYLAEGLRATVKPFNLGRFEIWVDEYSRPDPIVSIQIESLKKYPFKIRVDRYDGVTQPTAFLNAILDGFAAHFKGIYVEPDDHIQLGQE